MNVLFFKVEDRLNFPETEARAPDGSIGVVDSLVGQLRDDLKQSAPGTQLVLYGSWTSDWNFDEEKCTPRGKYLIKKLDRKGLHLMDHTESLPSEKEQIEQYVLVHHIDSWQIWREEL